MKYRNFAQAAAGVLATALLAGGAIAQTETVPLPQTMTDTAPTPASDRGSLGAVIMMDRPVLAQREQLLQAQERTSVDTRTLGAGPARALRNAIQKEDDRQRSIEGNGTAK